MFTIVQTASRVVYAFGDNTAKELGFLPAKPVLTPKAFASTYATTNTVSDIGPGTRSVVFRSSGKTYGVGDNTAGELGTGVRGSQGRTWFL